MHSKTETKNNRDFSHFNADELQNEFKIGKCTVFLQTILILTVKSFYNHFNIC